MPRASAYHDAARNFRRTSAGLADLALDIRALDATAIGAIGPIADRHDAALADAGRDIATVTDELLRLAEVCDRRAAVCEEYAQRLSEYWTTPAHDRAGSLPPAPPARWASA